MTTTDEWATEYGYCNSCGEEAEMFTECCEDGEVVEYADERGGDDDRPDHDFLPVLGHPDDDECTHRPDGADATYCGRARGDHDVA